MEAVVETTVWNDSNLANHTYLLDGSKMVAYIKVGSTTPFYFKNPITIDKRGRKFVEVTPSPFQSAKPLAHIKTVVGSKGNTYSVDLEANTCTCPGFTFRGTCKHVNEMETA